jgi:flavin-binding protein dodecin
MAVIKVVELVGMSPTSWDDAVQNVVEEAARTLRHITGVDLVHQTACVEDGKITQYRATVHVAFQVEELRQIESAGEPHTR